MRSRSYWDEESILKTLIGICSEHGKFPTQDSFRDIGQSGLYRAMTYRGGLQRWRDKMSGIGFGHEQTLTETGWMAEEIVMRELQASGFSVLRIPGKKLHYDLLVDSVLRVEVKGARKLTYARNENGERTSCWYFGLGKRPSADIIVLHRFDRNDTFYIPWYFCPNSTISIGEKSEKYGRWLNRLDVPRTMSNIRHSEMEDYK